MNFSVFRKIVQLAAFLFLVYGAAIVGPYATDKISQSLPTLSCAYNAKSADYCTLIVLQHQVDHRIGGFLASGGSLVAAFMPTVISLGVFLVAFVLLGKMFCGWLCPMGFFQEVATLTGQKLKLTGAGLSDKTVDRVRPVKWAVLSLMVLGFPLMAGAGLLGHDFGAPFCNICPSRIVNTLAGADTTQVYADLSSPTLFAWSLIGTVLFGFISTSGLTVRQPFCRVCPMLALHAVFKRMGIPRLIKKTSAKCEPCGLCARACPMDIRELHADKPGNVTHTDCTLCGRCVEFCPGKGTLSLRYGFAPVFSSDPKYFAARNRRQKAWLGKKKHHDA